MGCDSLLTERNIKIMKYIISSSESISIKYLAELFNLSERSIRYDIENINYILKDNDLPVINRNSGGVLTLEHKNLVQKYIESLTVFQYSLEVRSKLLLYMVALTGKINIANISRELDLSRSSVKADIEKIKPMLDSYRLELQISHKLGLVLTGDEIDIRTLQLRILLDFLTVSELEHLVVNDTINDFLGSIDTSVIDDFIYAIEKDTSNIITDDAFQLLKFYILIAVIRVQKKLTLKKPIHPNNLMNTDEYRSISQQKHILENYYSIKLNKQEILQIASIYIGSPTFNFPEAYYENWFVTEVLVHKLIKKFSLLYGLDLTKDKALIKELITFMKPTLYVINSDYHLHEVATSDEPILYPTIHSILLKLLNDFTFSKLKKMSKNRVAQLVNYFKASTERNKNNLRLNKNILLVCELGYDNSVLLAQELNQQYDINIIDTIPFHYAKNYDGLEDIDLIITTYNHDFPTIKKPIIKVNAKLTEADLMKLDAYPLPKSLNKIRLSKLINLIQSNSRLNKIIHVSDLLKSTMGNNLIDDLDDYQKGIDKMLNQSNVKVNLDVKDWEEAIKIAGQILMDSGSVTSNYVDSLIDVFSSYGDYMVIKEGIAIPHAKNKDNILKTGFALLILNKPVMTPFNKELRIILAFSSFDDTEHLEALCEFANLITFTDFIESAIDFRTPMELLLYIDSNKHLL